MLKIALVLGLFLPGMQEPRFQRTEMPTIEECLSKAAEALNGSKEHAGEEFIFSAGCFITGSKANPA